MPKQEELARLLTLREAFPPKHAPSQGKLDAAALGTAAIPGVGDLAGLLADANAMSNDPSLANLLMTVAGVIPFVPGGSAKRVGGKAKDLVTDLNKHKKVKKKQHDETINKIRMQATEEMRDMETAFRMKNIDPKSIHNVGDRFVTEGGVRLEIKKYDRVNDDGEVYYLVEQTFPDGRKGEVRLTNKNFEYTQKMGNVHLAELLKND